MADPQNQSVARPPRPFFGETQFEEAHNREVEQKFEHGITTGDPTITCADALTHTNIKWANRISTVTTDAYGPFLKGNFSGNLDGQFLLLEIGPTNPTQTTPYSRSKVFEHDLGRKPRFFHVMEFIQYDQSDASFAPAFGHWILRRDVPRYTETTAQIDFRVILHSDTSLPIRVLLLLR